MTDAIVTKCPLCGSSRVKFYMNFESELKKAQTHWHCFNCGCNINEQKWINESEMAI